MQPAVEEWTERWSIDCSADSFGVEPFREFQNITVSWHLHKSNLEIRDSIIIHAHGNAINAYNESGIEIQKNEFISETLVTHKSSGFKKVIKLNQNILWYAWLMINFTIKSSNSVPSSIG